MCPQRRDILIAAGGIASGAAGLSLISTNSNATQINIQELTIPDKKSQVANPVTSAQLAVSGEYQLDSEVLPTRVILRLEGKRATERDYKQLAAEEPSQPLEKEFTESFAFQANLLDLDRVTAPNLTPAETGESESMDLDIRLRLIVKNDGKIVKEVSVEESLRLTVQKTLGEVTLGLNATGNVSVSD